MRYARLSLGDSRLDRLLDHGACKRGDVEGGVREHGLRDGT